MATWWQFPSMVHKFLKLANILKTHFFWPALSRGSAAATEHLSILRSLGNCKCVVDIGANRGQFSLVARRIFPGAEIHAFEPLYEPARIFRRVFSEDDLVTLYPFAIGPERMDAEIHVSIKDDSSSLLPIGESQSKLFPRTQEKEIRQISVFPLSDLMDADSIVAPALLKIDVQGYELEVLKGCAPLLDHFQYLYVECSFIELYKGQSLANEIIGFLNQHAFCLVGIYNMCYDRKGLAIQGDFLFAADEKTQPR